LVTSFGTETFNIPQLPPSTGKLTRVWTTVGGSVAHTFRVTNSKDYPVHFAFSNAGISITYLGETTRHGGVWGYGDIRPGISHVVPALSYSAFRQVPVDEFVGDEMNTIPLSYVAFAYSGVRPDVGLSISYVGLEGFRGRTTSGISLNVMYEFEPVPEPSTAILSGAAIFIGVAVTAMRRRKPPST
jgi:hypothetical protein